MANNLPFLPDKDGVECTDVRQVLREVFRELDYCTPPSRNVRSGERSGERSGVRSRVSGERSGVVDRVGVPLGEKYSINNSSADHTKLYQQELELQKQYAKRLSREPLPNIYQLQSPAASPEVDTKKSGPLILKRKDLKPSVDQDAGGDQSLWVRNILNRSSGELGALGVVESRLKLPVMLEPADEDSVQSVSIGELLPRPIPPPTAPAPRAPDPTCVVCVPPRLDFVNFTVGQLHTQSIRLVNVSKFEQRLSVRPPARRELDVLLCSRLLLSAGAAAELRVRLRARDVRALSDELGVRVSGGGALRIPIACYMEPPELHISIIPLVTFPCSSAAESAPARCGELELGARLLGDVHRVPYALRCAAAHAAFFLMSEESWDNLNLQVTTSSTSSGRRTGISTDCFYLTPARWRGGGARGLAVCRAAAPGLHAAALRVVSSTATVRSLSLLADAVLFSPHHVTLQAHEKEYDIRCEGDPACEYYVDLGVTFPRRSLSANIKIINNSPLIYEYRWSARAWGACSGWESCPLPAGEGEPRAPDPQEITKQGQQGGRALSDEEEARRAVHVSAASGRLSPRSETTVRVHVPDVGSLLRVRRAVLMLILKNVPEDSFPSDYRPVVVNTNEIEEQCIPGICAKWSRKVCDVVCAQLEVWWRVAPVRFALDPPLLVLPYSRRVKSVKVSLRATQLYGVAKVRASWSQLSPAPPPLTLAPGQPVLTAVLLPFEDLPDQFQHSQLIQLVAESDEWKSTCRVERWCSTRHPALHPVSLWLGVLPPGAPVAAELTVLNDTHQRICWWASVHRWCRERGPAGPCAVRAPCAACHSRACACDALEPARGVLDHDQSTTLRYCVNAPDTDGCVATLVRVQHTAGDAARAPGGRGTEARAALLAYRVLAPRLVLRVKPCRGDKTRGCEGCALDPGVSTAGGSPVLRPSAALSLADRSCCLVQITNITPLSTTVQWTPAIEGEDILAVTFIPNEFNIGGHTSVEILVHPSPTVVLEGRRQCARRLFVRAARVAHAHAPLYLLIDAAISGVEVMVEFPIGGAEHTDSCARIRMMQSQSRNNSHELLTPEQIFARDDRKRALQKENICHCPYEMIYIPPPAPPPPNGVAEECGEQSPVTILEEPPAPPLVRTCRCCGATRPVSPEHSEPYCLQFHNLPSRTVRSRTLVLRNESRSDAHWRACVRRWPRTHTRTADKEQWAGDEHAPGVVLQCAPGRGSLPARRGAELVVSVYADCWGLYRDQILIQVEGLEPLVLDAWVQAVGAPLHFPLSAAHPPTLWMSHSDPEHVVHVTNSSRADLSTHVYLVKENEFPQDELPFRLYLRFFDVPPQICPCVTAFESNDGGSEAMCTGSDRSALETDTGVELFLAPDHGLQSSDDCYQVEPQQLSVRAGARAALAVRLRRQHEPAPPHTLLLRSTPHPRAGPGWWRPVPPLQLVRLRCAQRVARLHASRADLRVALCALDLPADDVLRVRKKFLVRNTGEGPLEVMAATEAPWRVGVSRDVCDAHCAPRDARNQLEHLHLQLAARSCIELFAEVCVSAWGTRGTRGTWPAPGAAYPPQIRTTTALNFYDPEDILLLSMPLVLDVELPVLRTQPQVVDFGLVSDGSTKKSYFTVSHTSRSTLELEVQWSGAGQFRLSPARLVLRPGDRATVYVQYTARWASDGVSEGEACVRACGAARAWCRAALRVLGRVTRARALHAAPHEDHTDDAQLLPPAPAESEDRQL